MKTKIIPCYYLKDNCLVKNFDDEEIISNNPVKTITDASIKGADAVIIFDLSESDDEHEESLLMIRRITQSIDTPIYGAGNVKRLEDIKKLIYAGCKKAILNLSKASNIDLIAESGKRFGSDRIMVCAVDSSSLSANNDVIKKYTSGIIILNDADSIIDDIEIIRVIDEACSADELCNMVNEGFAVSISGDTISNYPSSYFDLKYEMSENGIETYSINANLQFDDLKLNSDGMVPVVVQDINTDEVLMVAYMNEEAYTQTVRTGIMTYYSRSRNELWVKGLTSGHLQYAKELYADCDKDTILAKVVQIGNACHTGSHSCFFNDIFNTDYESSNPYHVFEYLSAVIHDRKLNPKEGSYTNYLFDKGIDKILKKVGEEATEIVIAAKNPEKEEVKYEIADFLYHMMVLMEECNLSWNEITQELKNR